MYKKVNNLKYHVEDDALWPYCTVYIRHSVLDRETKSILPIFNIFSWCNMDVLSLNYMVIRYISVTYH